MATMTQADIDAIRNGQGAFQSGQADAFVIGSDIFANNPSLMGRYYSRNRQKMTTLQKMRMFFPGRLSTSPSSSPIIGHYEGIDMRNTVTISAITAGSAANEAVLTIDPADVYTETPYGAPAPVTRTRPRIKDTIQVTAGGPLYVVIAKSANQQQITIKSFDSAAPSAEITPGTTVVVGAPIKSEGTDQIAPLRKLRARYENGFWISPETDVVTGSHLTSRGDARMLEDGRIYLEGIKDAEFRSEANKSDVWLFGQQVATGNSIGMYSEPLGENTYLTGTQGLLDYAEMLGETIEVDPAGMTFDDFYGLVNVYHDLGINVETLMMFLGSNLNAKVEAAWSTRIDYSWVIGVSDQYVPQDARSYWGTSEDQIRGAFVNLGINGAVIDNVKFLKTSVPEFNDGRARGAIGYKDWGVIAPFGYAPTLDGPEIPMMGYQYRGVSGYSRENEVWVKTGAGNSSILTGTTFANLYKTSQWDAAQFFLRWEIAPEFAGGDQYIVLQPATGS